ncbi:hypothetical protein OC835_000008 [Tilletia horrida]|nr:hypothetical protein OC835_000008 [Tilletia horrida]
MCRRTDAPVLVTGCTGYIGAAVALDLLQHGYRVRGTVRSLAKFDRLLAQPAFAPYRHTSSGSGSSSSATADPPRHFEAVVVEDLVTSDFSQAMQGGVQVVMHTASPCLMTTENVEEAVLKPAIEGTKNVVRAAIDAGSVTHIVFTSSFGSIFSFSDGAPVAHPAPRVYTEADFNSASYEDALVSDMEGFAYAVSKSLAERAATDLVRAAPGRPIRLTSLCGTFVVGPFVHAVDDLDAFNDCNARLWRIISGQTGGVLPPWGFPVASDLHALASAHRLAFERNQEGRFLISSCETFDMALIVDVARQYFPEHAHRLPKVKPSDRFIGRSDIFRTDATRSRELLGVEYQPLELAVRDALQRLYEAEKELSAESAASP